jgi:hypothetical protein
VQVVRDLLLHGPVKIAGKTHPDVCDYYVEISKRIERGHKSNVSEKNVSQAIRSPLLQVNGHILNHQCAIVCDVVHWGLLDYARKRAAWENNRQCSLIFCLVVFFCVTAYHSHECQKCQKYPSTGTL